MNVWKGDHYDITLTQTVSLPAQRSVVALVGGSGDNVSVQFVEKNKELVGVHFCSIPVCFIDVYPQVPIS